MSIFTAIYNLLIGPLELFFEILYSLVNHVLDNPGLSIVFLSLAMNFLVLPLYKMADALQAEEQATEARLRDGVSHIKKTFRGDERFMILQTYYRQNHYKPTDALKGSVSLLLEIPFFMAAYHFLSSLPVLQGAWFGPIRNLGAPDGLIVLGGIAINVLPILMTVINLISSAIYTKGSSLRSKVQLYVMAGLFLILLYDSPSGLVFYWTLNNLFSLVKNIFMKLQNPGKVFGWLCSATGVAATASVILLHPVESVLSQILLIGLTLLLQLPLILGYAKRTQKGSAAAAVSAGDGKTFWACGLFLAVFTGLLIPSGVIHASPEEFLTPVTQTSPLLYIVNAALTAAGFFLIWFGVFYLLAKDSGKKWMSCGICILSVAAIVDFMFFGRDYGNMSPALVFDHLPAFGQKGLNLLVLAAAAGAVWYLWKKKQELIRFAAVAAALACILMSGLNMADIHRIASEKSDQMEQTAQELPVIPLSRNGKNVIVLMMDRGVSSYVPYLLEEKPQLKAQFAGFTYYPNTISYGGHTNFGAPALFGGYEYTPREMNKRDTEPLQRKNDEALKVMPVSFLNQGYEVTVCDPPCAGYDWIPDLTIYRDYPQIHTYNSMQTIRTPDDAIRQDRISRDQWNRNFFCYSLMKISPVCTQPYLYDEGKYHNFGRPGRQNLNGLYEAEGINLHFSHAYSVLSNLSTMTEIREDGENTFLMLTNDTTHEPTLLQEPEYIPAEQVDNRFCADKYRKGLTLDGRTLPMDTAVQIKHYHINMAAFLKLGEWFDYLRQEQVFDNTRVILVSDHGYATHQRSDLMVDGGEDLMFYNPVLMVKDFGASEFRVDHRFMTNADTPRLAMEGLIEDPVNPFTGRRIDDAEKFSHPQDILCSHIFSTYENNGTKFLPGVWYQVHDDIFNPDNWTILGTE